MSDYWFFLSYARRNDISYTLGSRTEQRSLVAQFYEELAAAIIDQTPTGTATSPEQIGFFDQSGIEPGDKWDDSVADALRTARVMLCLFTRNYFNSKVCGQEYEVFRARVEDFAKPKNIEHPPLIIPILWHAQDQLPKPLPAVTADLQYTYDKFPQLYADRGLKYLMNLQRNHDDYQEFLEKMADRVINVAKEHEMHASAVCPPLTSVRNAFETAPALVQAGAAAAPQSTGPGGPSFIRFVFVVGNRVELQTIRQKADAYANDTRLWQPYLPHEEKTIGLLAQLAATSAELQQEVVPVTNALMNELETADDKNIIVVLIVDPWSLRLQLYEQQMKLYNKRNFVSCGVLVLWNELEQEPGIAPATLQSTVRTTFSNIVINNNLYFRSEISSENALQNELAAAITEIRRRLTERGKLFRPVDEGGYNAIPQVSTPGGATS